MGTSKFPIAFFLRTGKRTKCSYLKALIYAPEHATILPWNHQDKCSYLELAD
jgi:hypothetical protein